VRAGLWYTFESLIGSWAFRSAYIAVDAITLPSGECKEMDRLERFSGGSLRTTAALFRDVIEFVRPQKTLLSACLVLIVLGRACAVVIPASLRFLIDGLMKHRSTAPVCRVLVLIIAMVALQAAITYVQARLLNRASILLVTDIRRRIQLHTISLPLRMIDQFRTGTLVTLVMEDVESIRNLAHAGMINFLTALVGAGVSVVALAIISPVLTAAVFSVFATYAFLSRSTLEQLRQLCSERFQMRGEIAGRLSESLAGIRLIKAYCREEQEARLFSAQLDSHLRNRLRTVELNARLASLTVVPLGIATAMLAGVGAHQIASSALTVGGFVAFSALLPYLLAPISQMPDIITDMSEASAGFGRVRAALSENTEQLTGSGVQLRATRGELEFRGVSFGYTNERRALRDISFSVAAGSVTLIVGSSGAGKSTIAGLLAGFYPPDCGSIHIDGLDLAQVDLKSRRTCLAMVMQETFLFSGTLRQNLLFPRPEATDAEVENACRLAGLQGFIQNQRNGYDTMIGERGVTLSGGERQRLSIARAILADPQILVMDEPTSNLDTEWERIVQKNIREFAQGRTTLIITHRLSAAWNADQILVLDDGCIVERGTHSDLMDAGGQYSRLCLRQNHASSIQSD
jgi:ABC-type multidrug transport system fused ATPase/permease subunit